MAIQVGPWSVQQQIAKGGPITEPTAKQVARTRAALDALADDVDTARLLPLGCRVVYGWVANIPGTSSPAAGYTTNKTTTRIRWGMPNAANLQLDSNVAVIIHESLGHAHLGQVPMSDSQHEAALALLGGPAIPAHDDWRDVWVQAPGDKALAAKLGIDEYWLRPYEGLIASVVGALTDGEALEPWFKKYKRTVPRARWADLKALWLNTVANVPEEPDLPSEPPPSPDYPGIIAGLEAQVAAYEALNALDLQDATSAAALLDAIVKRNAPAT